jgi:serine/threonine-protein kinase
VWRATLEGPHGFARPLVLKRVRRDKASSEAALEQLLAEARLSARLEHAGIAQVYEIVEAEGSIAVAMEWIDGVELSRVFAARRAPHPGLAAFVVGEVARALAHAHARSIVHRDVSPANVMLARSGAVKLVDFGIARLYDELVEPATRTASLKGSLAYMAPEQLARRTAGPAADVYAAGVLLYELSTGKRLYASLYELAELAEARATPPAPPSSLGAPAALDAICARALAVAPEERYRDGAELAAALPPVVESLGFGGAQLAGLVADLMEAEADARPPQRHTESVAVGPIDAAPTVVDPPRASGARRWWLAAALGAACVAGALTWRALHHADSAPAPSAAPAVVEPPRADAPPAKHTDEEAPIQAVDKPPTPAVAPPATTAVAPPATHTEPAADKSAPRGKRKPHLVDGKLLDPFHR